MSKKISITYQTVLDAAFAVLTRRAHSEQELRQKLLRKFTVKKTSASTSLGKEVQQFIDQVVVRLYELKYLDDAKFAYDLVRLKQGQGKGASWLRQYLRTKGISADVIDHALAEQCTDDAQLQAALQIAAKKWPQLQQKTADAYQQKTKLYGFLQRRGFGYGLCEQVWDELTKK